MGKSASKLKREEKRARAGTADGPKSEKEPSMQAAARAIPKPDLAPAGAPASKREEKSSELSPEDLHVDEAKWTKFFTQNELMGLKKCYCVLATHEGMSKKIFDDEALGLKPSLYTDRIFSIFDTNSDGLMSIDEFLSSMSVLTSKGSDDDKIRISYQILTPPGEKGINRAALKEMLLACLQDYGDYAGNLKLNSQQVEEIIDRTFQEADTNHDGLIDFAEYQALMRKTATQTPMSEFLTIDIPGVITTIDRTLSKY